METGGDGASVNRKGLVLVALGAAVLEMSTTASAQHHRHRRRREASPEATPQVAPSTPREPGPVPPAPPASAPDPEDAEYQPAIEAANRGQREEALAMFRAIFERTHSPRALGRIGTTEIQMGRWLAAEEHLQGTLGGEQDAWVTRHRAALEEALGRVQQNLADLEVVCPVEGAALSLNGQPAGAFPLAHPARVVRGNVTIDVTAAGYEPFRQVLTVTSAHAQTEVTLVRSVVRATAGSQQVGLMARGDETRSWQRPLGWVTLSTGVALLIVGGVEWLTSFGQRSSMMEANSLSPEPYGSLARFEANENYARTRSFSEVCDLAQQRSGADAAQVRDLCSSNNSTLGLAWGFGIAGAAVTVVGTVLLATSPARHHVPRGLSLGPTWSGTSAGGLMTWHF